VKLAKLGKGPMLRNMNLASKIAGIENLALMTLLISAKTPSTFSEACDRKTTSSPLSRTASTEHMLTSSLAASMTLKPTLASSACSCAMRSMTSDLASPFNTL